MDTFSFQIIPANSTFALPDKETREYIALTIKLPKKVQEVLYSSNTGSYILGLGKSYQIPMDQQIIISFSILRICVKKLMLSQLAETLAKELNIDIDTAVKMASEIDQDLFAPIQGELEAFWASQKQTTTTNPSPLPSPRTGEGNARTTTAPRTPNVLNLKELNAKPEQKDLPAAPTQRKLMPGPTSPRLRGVKNRTVDLSQRPGEASRPQRPAPLPPPLTPPRAGGETAAPTTPRTFPLPPNPRP